MNCGETHPASSRDCFYYNFEQETITIHTRERISYYEAKRIAEDKVLQPNITCANITSRTTKNTVITKQEWQKKLPQTIRELNTHETPPSQKEPQIEQQQLQLIPKQPNQQEQNSNINESNDQTNNIKTIVSNRNRPTGEQQNDNTKKRAGCGESE